MRTVRALAIIGVFVVWGFGGPQWISFVLFMLAFTLTTVIRTWEKGVTK